MQGQKLQDYEVVEQQPKVNFLLMKHSATAEINRPEVWCLPATCTASYLEWKEKMIFISLSKEFHFLLILHELALQNLFCFMKLSFRCFYTSLSVYSLFNSGACGQFILSDMFIHCQVYFPPKRWSLLKTSLVSLVILQTCCAFRISSLTSGVFELKGLTQFSWVNFWESDWGRDLLILEARIRVFEI
jgi:hypothetical protein